MTNKNKFFTLIFCFCCVLQLASFAQNKGNNEKLLRKYKDTCGSCVRRPWICDLYKKHTQLINIMPLIAGFNIDGLKRFNYGIAFGYGYFLRDKLLIDLIHEPYITIDNQFEHMFTFDNTIKIKKYFAECRTNFYVCAGIGNTLFNYKPVPNYLFMNDVPQDKRVTHNQTYLFPGVGFSFKIRKKFTFDAGVNYNLIITNKGRGRVVPISINIMFNIHNLKHANTGSINRNAHSPHK